MIFISAWIIFYYFLIRLSETFEHLYSSLKSVSIVKGSVADQKVDQIESGRIKIQTKISSIKRREEETDKIQEKYLKKEEDKKKLQYRKEMFRKRKDMYRRGMPFYIPLLQSISEDCQLEINVLPIHKPYAGYSTVIISSADRLLKSYNRQIKIAHLKDVMKTDEERSREKRLRREQAMQERDKERARIQRIIADITEDYRKKREEKQEILRKQEEEARQQQKRDKKHMKEEAKKKKKEQKEEAKKRKLEKKEKKRLKKEKRKAEQILKDGQSEQEHHQRSIWIETSFL